MSLATAVLLISVQSAAAPAAGVLVERVACPSDPDQTYTLYLPSAYSAAKKWPLLFVFDPRGRGTQAAAVFKEAAERFGWIIASSNNTSSDGDWEPNRRALAAMWPDVRRTYAVDERRIYAAGFSGGATVAWILAETTGAVAGVIAAGAPDRPDAKLLPKSAAWFATAGRADFNFLDTKRTAARLERAAISNRVEFFDGGHQWMPSGLATRGLAWLELRAMTDGRRAKDPELARTLIDEDLAHARDLEQAGAWTDALNVYATVIKNYGGAGDVAAAGARKTELERDERVKAAAREEQRVDSRERAVLAGIWKTLRGLGEPELPLPAQLIAALGINGLRREAEGKGYEAASATRVLEVLGVQTSFYLPRDFARQKQYDRAALALEIATAAHPDRPRPWLELAVTRLALNQKARALSAVERAIEAGYRDRASLEADPRFAPLLGTPDFQALLTRLR